MAWPAARSRCASDSAWSGLSARRASDAGRAKYSAAASSIRPRCKASRTVDGSGARLGAPISPARREVARRAMTNAAPAEVGAVGDPAGAGEEERQEVVDHQVDAEHDPRRNLEDVPEERRQEEQNPDGVPREPHEIKAEHARDRAGGADQRDVGAEKEHGVEQRRRDAGDQVPENEGQRAQAVLDVVAVDPQEEHVPGEVEQPPVEKQREQQIEDRRGGRPVAVLEDEEIVGRDLAGDRAELLAAADELGEELEVLDECRVRSVGRLHSQRQADDDVDGDVYGDDGPGRDRLHLRVRGIGDGQEHRHIVPPSARRCTMLGSHPHTSTRVRLSCWLSFRTAPSGPVQPLFSSHRWLQWVAPCMSVWSRRRRISGLNARAMAKSGWQIQL